jgi:hypothetical protein
MGISYAYSTPLAAEVLESLTGVKHQADAVDGI